MEKKRPSKSPGNEEAQHVLLRVRTDGGETIVSHNSVLSQCGSAMLGKMGKPLGEKFISLLNSQIERGEKTYLFLTTREGWNGPYVTYQCLLAHIHSALPESKESLVPSYYFNERAKVSTWFEIVAIGKMSKNEMNQIHVRSSGRTIMSVIGSSAAVFYVSYPGGLVAPLASGMVSDKKRRTTLTDFEDDSDDFDAGDVDISDLGIDGI